MNRIFLDASMNSSCLIKLKLLDNSVNSVYFLSNRVNERTRGSGSNSQWNTWETSASAHIEIGKVGGIKIPSKDKRIKKMKNNRIIKIGNTREINVRIDLLNIEKMHEAVLSLSRRKSDIKARTDIKELFRQNLDLLVRILELLQNDGATSHSYSLINFD